MKIRPKRLRYSKEIRRLTKETFLTKDDFIYPLFIEEGKNIKTPIDSMPGIHRYSLDKINQEIEPLIKLGMNRFLLFGIPKRKDENGLLSTKKDTIIYKAIKFLKKTYPTIYLITDVCFCEYTSHGHCGIIKNDYIDNDATLQMIAKQALLHAEAGADMVAPSGMADGMVKAIRTALDTHNFINVAIMSYSAKYHSAYYGPFREGVNSSPSFGNRATYQMDASNSKEALKEVLIDTKEGADIIMIKPALSYLDVISKVSQSSLLPIAAYQVSGEYSLIKMAGKSGVMDEANLMVESLTSIKRAGAGLIISYFTKDILKII